MHNRLYTAGWQSFVDGQPCQPRSDPVVREYTAGLPVGDQLAYDIEQIFESGFHDARAEGKVRGDTTR
jgi:hypothetical protein